MSERSVFKQTDTTGLMLLREEENETLFVPADIQQLDAHMKNKKQREQEARDPMITQLQQMIDGFQSSTDQLASSITATVRAEVQHQMQMMVGKYVSDPSLIRRPVRRKY